MDTNISIHLENIKVIWVMSTAPLWLVNMANREAADSQGGFYSW